MSLQSLCIKRPVLTTLLSSAVVVFGLFAYRLLPVAALPTIDYPTIVVFGTLPGASPDVMAATVALPLEKNFATIPGVTDISSVNSTGSTQITLQFDLSRDIDGAALDVQSAITLSARQLPPQMPAPPSFRKVNPSESPIVFLSLNSATLPLSQVDEYAETIISPKLSTLPGVAEVSIFGQQKFAIRIDYNPSALAERNLAANEVANAVIKADSSTPTGTISTSNQQITVASDDQMLSAADYRNLVVAFRNGGPVRLGDVAKVEESVQNTQVASWWQGNRSIVLAVQRQPGSNTVEVADSVTSLLPSFRAQMPPTVNLEVLNDRSVSIRHSVEDVQFTLILTIALVVMVIFLFLRNLTATLVPAVVLPISLIGTCALMYLFGYSIDNLSLMALTLAVGFVVDDAIVMLENIVRHVEEGMPVMQAAIKGSGEIGFTIMSMTLSLIAAFIPVLLMGGIVGRLFHEFAVTIAATILISGVVSLTLTPMMCSRMLRSRRPGTTATAEHGGRFFQFILKGYARTLDVALRFRLVMLLITLVTLAGTIYLGMIVPKGFFPTEDTGLITGTFEASQDASFDKMVRLQGPLTATLAKDPDVSSLNTSVGFNGFSALMNDGQVLVVLKDRPPRKRDITQVIQDLRRENFGNADLNLYLRPVQNLSVGVRASKALYQYTIDSTNLADLYRYAPEMEERIAKLPGLQDVNSDLQIRSPRVVVSVDRANAAVLGVDVDSIKTMLNLTFGTDQITQLYTPTDEFEVIMEIDPALATGIDVLDRLYVRSANGKLVPMDQLARVSMSVGPLQISHDGQLPAATISFNLAPNFSLGQATAEISELEHQLNLPPTITTGFRGTAQVFQDSLAGQGFLIAAAVITIYIVLGCLYESFVHPITIISGLPSAAVGALATLILFRTDLSVISIIGLVMLIGIVKKNAIMMIDFAITRRQQGYEPLAAIREACLLRFRPIMMTTMSALMGSLPIAFGFGAGGELRQPLGLTVVGGLVVSQALTLYITPVIYLYLEGLATFFRRAPAPREAKEAAE